MERPTLEVSMEAETFHQYYYLKTELVAFCKANGLSSGGGKAELTNRISVFLKTGARLPATASRTYKATTTPITLDTTIESDFICSEHHRTFFKTHIGDTFSFYVPFQKWLKANTGKTYQDAIQAYYEILQAKKQKKTTIDKQFEYNTYIRDFFADNKGASLQNAIACWNYKKQLAGHNRYERFDLQAIACKRVSQD